MNGNVFSPHFVGMATIISKYVGNSEFTRKPRISCAMATQDCCRMSSGPLHSSSSLHCISADPTQFLQLSLHSNTISRMASLGAYSLNFILKKKKESPRIETCLNGPSGCLMCWMDRKAQLIIHLHLPRAIKRVWSLGRLVTFALPAIQLG